VGVEMKSNMMIVVWVVFAIFTVIQFYTWPMYGNVDSEKIKSTIFFLGAILVLIYFKRKDEQDERRTQQKDQ
jgi:uncharacterized membrane protein YdjX (TVP38/TMEM64 family)